MRRTFMMAAFAAVRLDAPLDELRAAVTALLLDAPLDALRAATPSAECAPDCIPESALVLPSAEAVLAEGAFALAVFIAASVAGGASGIRGMPDTPMRATTIRTGGGTRLPLMTMIRIANWHWPARWTP